MAGKAHWVIDVMGLLVHGGGADGSSVKCYYRLLMQNDSRDRHTCSD